MVHFEFKKRPWHHVKFSGLDPYTYMCVQDHGASLSKRVVGVIIIVIPTELKNNL